MSLHLDARQRAMLQEMGVHVWQAASASSPEATVALVAPVASVARATAGAAPPPASTPAAQTPAPARASHPPLAAPTLASAPVQSASAVPVLHPPRQLYPAVAEAPPAPSDLGPAWLIVAECRPDADPLAGDAGALLHNMLRALQLHRHPQVFFCGVELASANQPDAPFGPDAVLTQALAQIQPAMVLLMGRLAARAALGRTEPLGQLRAQPHSLGGVYPAIVTYDAPYLLRQSSQGKYKAAAWADLCHARNLLRARP